MRLINARTLQLEEYFGSIPKYYILSHRWTNDEITCKDFIKGRRKESLGYKKVVAFCEFALHHHERNTFGSVFDTIEESRQKPCYVWIDTCCIDKKSSAELSEAINSMYSFYEHAEVCFAYLADVDSKLDSEVEGKQDALAASGMEDDSVSTRLARSTWFTRGWTLQELLAPETVAFVDCDWRIVGCKTAWERRYRVKYANLNNVIERTTEINKKYLRERALIGKACIARRMSWAASRVTTRIEDTTYCLLGLFRVNMPLLYGEGAKAFIRLQEELIRTSTDKSIFAWSPLQQQIERASLEFGYLTTGILAPLPIYFQHCGSVSHYKHEELRDAYAITNAGLEVRMQTSETNFEVISHDQSRHARVPKLTYWYQDYPSLHALVARLNCWYEHSQGEYVGFELVEITLLPYHQKVSDGVTLIRACRLHRLPSGSQLEKTGPEVERKLILDLVMPEHPDDYRIARGPMRDTLLLA